MNNPLVSVIIPIYNTEKYLRRCIDSVLNQTYQHFEMILVDDGSIDNCGFICDEYAKKDQRVVAVHKENGGLSSARNTGIKIAKGSYVVFLDSDDYIYPEMIEKMLKASIRNKCEIVQCSMLDCSDNCQKIMNSGDLQILSSEMALRQIGETEFVSACNKIYQKELFADITFPVGKIHEDVGTTYRLFYKCNRIAVISDVLYVYCENHDSITKSKIKNNKLDLLDIYAEQICFFREKGLKQHELCAANNLAANFGALLCCEASRYQNYDAFLQSMQSKFSSMRKLVLSNTPLRWDLRAAVILSCGNVKGMRCYHKIKCWLKRLVHIC